VFDVSPQGKRTADPDIVYREGVNIGYQECDTAGVAPLLTFGYSRSYTSVRYPLTIPRS
jgi:hypothetical protein